jgi:hypothetical protein
LIDEQNLSKKQRSGRPCAAPVFSVGDANPTQAASNCADRPRGRRDMLAVVIRALRAERGT